jgi:hypothetical protein
LSQCRTGLVSAASGDGVGGFDHRAEQPSSTRLGNVDHPLQFG